MCDFFSTLKHCKERGVRKGGERLKNRYANFEKETDELVYKLYDLTEEEIKIIEGGK
ncbi:MAG: hypothetical protein ACPLKS_07710 [Caldisericum exile]|uniref:hypothetical protein n=1 Tax=Caldisericum exile TaxID=693075 RepID=UPI003C763EF8